MYLIILLLPLINTLFLGLGGRFFGTKGSGILSTICIGSSWLISLILAYEILINDAIVQINLYKWIESELLITHMGLLYDKISMVMLVVITSISALVHIYSTSYMSDDPHVPRFLCYLSLFTLLMMILVTSDNYLQLFIGWEGVGICSYLLVAFWTTRIQANKAAIKAIIVNRVGDVAVILGFILIFLSFGSLDYITTSVVTQIKKEYIGILLLIGAIGKSAQLGLHTWLPDAMEGPTPVSALIHAATMVTAGVFLLIRSFPLIENVPSTLLIITIFGALTAFFGATVGLVQNDLKKVIAYSTCSQLGYMILIIGLGSHTVGLFHLVNHAFFKALLFLSAGSVIHTLVDEQDMRKMGGLIHSIPFTYSVMLIGSFSIMGFPYLTGYYSKDLILELAYSHRNLLLPSRGSVFAFWLGTISAFLTAFYSIRLIYLTFIIPPNYPRDSFKFPLKADPILFFVFLFLSFGAIFIGYLTQDIIIGEISHPLVPPLIKILPTLMGLFGMFFCLFLWKFWQFIPFGFFWKGILPIYYFLGGAWQFNHIFSYLIIVPVFNFGDKITYKIIDRGLLELIGPQGLVFLFIRILRTLSHSQSGVLSGYALIILSFSIIFLTLFIY
uniref:NADH-ubiquinone oxidoreductase chain 5 n=1 Tax=Polyplacotoma mediterranea TaxID=2283839 RepID=A0A481YLZ5_9METZ|nr:NADH dehydrogenase subunit 5 [Polyplacotoma mediterranea]QBK82185.1 NADH dehydrogenase subunit 5 [Polyplacotoma mediterranea]